MEVPQVVIKQEKDDNFALAMGSDEICEPVPSWNDIKIEPDSEIGNQEYDLDVPDKIKIIGENDRDMLNCLLKGPLSEQESLSIKSGNREEMSGIGMLDNLVDGTLAVENEQLNVNGDEKSSMAKTLGNYYTKIRGRKVASCNLCHQKVSFKTFSLRSHLKIKHITQYNTLGRHTIRRFGRQGKRKADGRLQKTVESNDGTSPATYVHGRKRKYNTLARHTTRRFERQWIIKAYARLQRHCSAKKAVESTATAPVTSMDGPSSVAALSPEQKKTIDGMLLKMAAKAYQPITIVEGADFRDFVGALNPNYEIPDKKTLTEVYYSTLFRNIKAEQLRLIEEATDICLTVNYWTSKTGYSFLTISAHFITKMFELKHAMIISAKGTGPYAGNGYVTPALKLLDLQRMDHKFTSCVAKQAQYYASERMKQYECLGHKLLFCLQRATLGLKNTIDKVIKVAYLKHRYFEKLREYIAKKLDLFSAFTWIYLYRLIEFITKTQSTSRLKLPDLTEEEWKALAQFAAIFKPFQQAMREFCSEKFVSASKAIAVIMGLKTLLSNVIENKPELYDSIKLVMKILRSEMDEHFGDIENDEDITMCAALDPRYKLDIFGNDVRKRIYKDLVRKVLGLVMESRSTTTEADGDQESVNTDTTEVLDLWGHLKKARTLRQKDSDYSNRTLLARQEVDTYLGDESGSRECDPCDWWKDNADKYPHLSELFRTSWQLRAVSVAGKELFVEDFSTADLRNCLTVEETAMFAFLNANLEGAEDYKKYM